MTHPEAQALLTKLDPQATLPAEKDMVSPFILPKPVGCEWADCLSEYLFNAFSWKVTSQGHSYWKLQWIRAKEQGI